ncbi:MAG: 16S rRNA (guanine(527)-N(7))-methyltransferase RsmG [Nitrospirae bacterium]|nr:16S rRNA (guanine(527)-N(7))-methyltransferase RsmG [Nitrospirota bacterium]
MEHQLELRTFIISSARELGLAIGEVQAEQFLRYLTHLIEWNRVINLTAILDPDEIIIKHFVDSLAALVTTDFTDKSLVLDIGSGGGFPGIPIKIMKSGVRLVLVEPVQKKCSFLNSVVGLLKLQDVSIFNGTIEQYAQWPLRQLIDTVVIRALKCEGIQMHIPTLLAPKGKVVLYRTCPINNEEMWEAFHLVDEKILMLPQGSGKRVVSVIQRTT